MEILLLLVALVILMAIALVFALVGLVAYTIVIFFTELTFSSWIRLLIPLLAMAAVSAAGVALEKKDMFKKTWKKLGKRRLCMILALPVLIFATLFCQWVFFGDAHTYDYGYMRASDKEWDHWKGMGRRQPHVGVAPPMGRHFAKFNLDLGEHARLPLFGAYAGYDGGNLVMRRSFFSEEVKVSLNNDPKAIGLSLLGGRVAVRFHYRVGSFNPFERGKNEYGVIRYFDTRTGELVNEADESGQKHKGIRLIW